MTILDRFCKYLTAIEYPKEKTSWNVAGIIKGKITFIDLMLGTLLDGMVCHHKKVG